MMDTTSPRNGSAAGTGRAHVNRFATRSEIARLAGTSRAAITNWLKRHPDFPPPVSGQDREYFRLDEVLTWLESRPVPAPARHADEPAGTSYASRVRRKLTAIDSPVPAAEPFRLAPDHDGGGGPGPGRLGRAEELLRALFGHAAQTVRGSAARAQYTRLFFKLVFLRACAPARWEELQETRVGTDTGRQLRVIDDAVDATLRAHDVPYHSQGFVTRLEPPGATDIARVIQLVDDLCEVLGPDTFTRLLEAYEKEFSLSSEEFFTPRNLAQLAAGVLLCGATGSHRLFDPYARGGELLAAVVARVADPRTLAVRAEAQSRQDLDLVAMNLVMRRVSPQLAQGRATPRPWSYPDGKADLIVTNPPFGTKLDREPYRDADWPFGPPPANNSTYGWLQQVVSSLTEGGRAVVVMPLSAASSDNGRERAIREHMVAQGAVECVIALPRQLFNRTNIPVSLWVLRAPTGSCDRVLLIDARGESAQFGSRRVLTAQNRKVVEDAYRSFLAARADRRRHRGVSGLSLAVTHDELRAAGYSLAPEAYPALAEPAPDVRAPGTDVGEIVLGLARLRYDAALAEDRIGKLRPVPPSDRPATGGLPAGWQRVPLAEICQLRAGPSHSQFGPARLDKGDVPVVLPRHLRDGRVLDPIDPVTRQVQGVSPEVAARFDRYRLAVDDVVWVRTGVIGAPALVAAGQDGWLFSTNLVRLRRLERDAIDPDYLLAFLLMPTTVAWVTGQAGSTTVPSISTGKLGKLMVPVPPIDAQREIGELLRLLNSQIHAYANLVETRDALTEQLVSGALLTR